MNGMYANYMMLSTVYTEIIRAFLNVTLHPLIYRTLRPHIVVFKPEVCGLCTLCVLMTPWVCVWLLVLIIMLLSGIPHDLRVGWAALDTSDGAAV